LLLKTIEVIIEITISVDVIDINWLLKYIKYKKYIYIIKYIKMHVVI